MLLNKKAQGMSLNVIIIAAIALVIMVILIALVLNSGQGINVGVNHCESWQEGREWIDYACVPQGELCPEGMTSNNPRSCSQSSSNNPLTCCTRLF